MSEQYSFFLYYPIALCWDVLARSVLFIQYIQQQFTQFCANAVIGKIASSALLFFSSVSLCPCSASAPALLSSGFSIVRYPCRQWETFSSHTECIRIFMRLLKVLPPATCNLHGGRRGAELIYSLQIKSGVENQLVCAIYCFYLYRVNTLCLSYADPLATWRLF